MVSELNRLVTSRGGGRMNVYLTFDVEVWCGSWSELDRRFPAAFERYCYGRSEAGEFALPKTLEILNRHALTGVFFVEPLFSARFGEQWLAEVVGMIRSAGHDVQLHLHPEWTDEIAPPIIADVSRKRQHLVHYNQAEQRALIEFARTTLEAAKGEAVSAFRAGSFAANRDTFGALAAAGLRVDSSIDPCSDYAGGTLGRLHDLTGRRMVGDVVTYPVTVFRDGFGRRRPAKISACSYEELRSALLTACAAGVEDFVIVSHNFEMLKRGTSEPDWTVVRRFESLCRFLAAWPELFAVRPFPDADAELHSAPAHRSPLAVPLWPTARRYMEQALRRLH